MHTVFRIVYSTVYSTNKTPPTTHVLSKPSSERFSSRSARDFRHRLSGLIRVKPRPAPSYGESCLLIQAHFLLSVLCI